MENLYQIREISTLSFNERVLQEAEDKRNPLLERLKFLGIFSSNMDEFFKVRVASMHRRFEMGKRGMTELLEVVSDKSRDLDERFQDAYHDIIQGLAAHGIRLLTEQDIDGQGEHLAEWLDDYFRIKVMPSLVPIIIHKSRPFPQLTDGALYFGIKMRGEKDRYAILELPQELPRFVTLPNGDIMYIDDVIRHSLNELFYIFEYDRIEAFEFKISRDAELDIDDDFSEGYVRKMEKVLQQRKGGRPTRFVYDAEMPAGLRQLLIKELNLSGEDTLIPGGRYHNMRDLMRFPSNRPELSFEPMAPAPHPDLDRDRTPIMRVMERKDLLITCPYQSFDHIIRLLLEAAIDPAVEEISMTLYRAAKFSRVVNALVNAARNGKKVFASIELQARFDEANNIHISERLMEEGVTVVYGVPPMKTHCKLLLIKKAKIQYAAFSTGNFNEDTGRLYVDSTLFTVDKRLTSEAAKVFELLANAARMRTLAQPLLKHLLVSPFNARKTILRLLARERAKKTDGYVFLKVNHLTDKKIIRSIEDTAKAGAQLDLVVRTTYAMVPHPNIRAISILDRFLEHQRVFIFGRKKDRVAYLSSSDLMERNLDWRVEVAFPIYDEECQRQLCDMMALQVEDNNKARILDERQSNAYVGGRKGGRRAQYATYEYLLNQYEASRIRS